MKSPWTYIFRQYTQGLQAMNEMKRFKQLYLDLSANLISVPPRMLKEEIEKGIERIARYKGIDRLFLVQLAPDGTGVQRIYPRSLSKTPGDFCADFEHDMPWLAGKVRGSESVLCSSSDLPDEALREKKLLAGEGIQTVMVVPLKAGEAIRGGLVVLTKQSQNDLSQDTAEDLYYLAETLANALERKRGAEKIDELICFEQLLSEISAKYISLPVDEIDQVIRMDLGRLCDLLEADRCVFFLLGDDRNTFKFSVPYSWWRHEDDNFMEQHVRWMENDPGFFENFQYQADNWRKGRYVRFVSLDELPPEAEKLKAAYAKFGVKSSMSMPIQVGHSTVGGLVFSTVHEFKNWPEEFLPRLRIFGEVFINAITRKRSEEELRQAFTQIKELKERIEADYHYLRSEINLEHDFSDVVGKSNALKEVLVLAKQVAPTDATVLILGETGTGKGVIARGVHNRSSRKDRPFMQVNCATLTPTLIESELFGHEKGAFTGAQARRIGRFEMANGTTLFLDEIGEIPLELQAKLLRVLQDGEFERVGGNVTIKTDVRVIAATNKDLVKEVEAGRFRRDLWYRLSIFPIKIPPLRERLDDIPHFVNHFVDRYGKWIGKKFDRVSQKTIKMLQGYRWPGNIRELENIIERAVITSPEGSLQIEIPALEHEKEKASTNKTLEENERDYILDVLEDCYWRIEGPMGAALRLGVNPSTLRTRMRKLGVRRPGRKNGEAG